MDKLSFKKDYLEGKKVEESTAMSEFEHWVNKTAQLINRPYFQTFKLVEAWQTHKIIRRYNECMEYSGNIPKDVLWWYLRKKDNQGV